MLRGEILDSTYEVLKNLGTGGMGEVYEVRHLALQKNMALKTLKAEATNPENWQRFVHEARILARLHHPAIVEIYDLSLTPTGQPFYTMELLRGLSLQEYLQKRGPIPEALALSLFKPVLAALACAHEAGVIHRDIKPHNIMLLGEATDFADPLLPSVRVKVVDFGLAKLRDGGSQQSLTVTGAVFGSPYYMSPEQCLGRKVDGRSDLYSTGCALFQSLTGLVPFAGASSADTMRAKVGQKAPRLSEVSALKFSRPLEELLAVLLATDPDDRFDNARQVLMSIEGEDEKARRNLFSARSSASEADSLGGSASGLEEQGRDIGHEGSSTLASPDKRRLLLFTLSGAALISVLILCLCLSPGLVKTALPAGPVAAETSAATGSSSPWFSTVDEAGGRVFDFSSIGSGLANAPEGLGPENLPLEEKWEAKRKKKWIANELGELVNMVDGGESRPLDLMHGVYVPPQADLRFRPGLPFYRKPNLLSRFRLDEIHSFDFRPAVGDGKRSFSDILPQLLPFTRLRELIFRDTRLAPGDLKDIGLMKNLTCLSLLTVDGITAEDLSRENMLVRLKQLRLDGMEDLSPVFRKLSGSKNIEILEIHTSNLSDAEVADLSAVKSLRDLRIRNCDLTDAQFRKLSALPLLRKLEVRNNAITFEGLKGNLPAFLGRSGKAASQDRLEVSLSARFCSPPQKSDLMRSFPQVNFKFVP